MSPRPRRQESRQRGQDRSIGPVGLGLDDLTPQHHDLGILDRLASAQEYQPAEHKDHDQIQEMDRHEN